MVGFPAIGDRIGPYRVDAEIGRGGMGIVYRATQLALNRPVALKILDPRFAADATFAARFSREANILASLDSPHVIQIFDHGVSDDRLYLAMQYVAGGDVGQLVARGGPLPPTMALQVYGHVLSALGDAHARGIVHRDVKPSNVLLRPDDTEPFAYLCDFGIAQTPEGGLTQPGLVAGSWAFMSPERHAGQPATAQSDLYSAACVLWAMLTGRNVYSGTDVQIAMAHMNAPVPQLPGSDPLIEALNRLFWANLAKNPAERPDSAGDALVLAQAPLGFAAGVAPLSISKPDSGIFRPASGAPSDAAAAPSPASGNLDEPTALASRHPALADAPAPPPGAPVAGAPQPPSPRGRLGTGARWLIGAGAIALTAALVFALMTWSGSIPQTSPTAGPGTASPPATATPAKALTYQCWNNVPVTDLGQCPPPRGESGLRWVYPSLDAVWDTCQFVAYRATTDTYECEDDNGLIRYRYWQDAAEAARHYKKEFADGKSTKMLLDGAEVGTLYRLNKKTKGIYKLTGFWLDNHFSFSLEAKTIPKREALLEKTLRIRAREQLAGREEGAQLQAGTIG